MAGGAGRTLLWENLRHFGGRWGELSGVNPYEKVKRSLTPASCLLYGPCWFVFFFFFFGGSFSIFSIEFKIFENHLRLMIRYRLSPLSCLIKESFPFTSLKHAVTLTAKPLKNRLEISQIP